MYRALNTSRTGMNAYQGKLDVVSNNLANSQTDGYKRVDTAFESLLKDSINSLGVPLSDNAGEGIAIGTGSRTSVPFRLWEQGILVADENPLALSLEGEGFFGVETDSEELLLTRNGHFGISSSGELVDESGFRVAVEDGKSFGEWSPEQIEVSATGELHATSTAGERMSMGRLKLYKPLSAEYLSESGEGYFVCDEKGLERMDLDVPEGTAVKQGFTEKSNVDIGREIVSMMISQRAYQMNARAVQSADEMWSLINNLQR